MKNSDKQFRLLGGNEAVVEGAVYAGCRFFAGYPITPATEIAEMMSVRLPPLGGTFIQMEDEIASMGAIIGASLAGAKALTATSGPGFSLMQENLGFACMAEVPCVVVNVMRGGPSTGMPTFPAQGDLMQSRWGTHGDHPIIVLCPSTVEECFALTVKAFNLSIQYRVPVILLMDGLLAHMKETMAVPEPGELEVEERRQPKEPPEWYVPYRNEPGGVPSMAAFGSGYRYHVTGLTHDEHGYPTTREDEADALIRRLHEKISRNLSQIQLGEHFRTRDAEALVVAYGSVARSAQRAVRMARDEGIRAGLYRPITVWPFTKREVSPLLEKAKCAIVPEMNMGQMSREVKRINQGMTKIATINRVDGRLITPGQILDCIHENML
ncbi:MAG: 2-oxoacid:acceptor oxidoreductase subunit alpha [bacterium]